MPLPKPLVKELSDEDLLAQLEEESDEIVEIVKNDDVLNFLSVFEIEKGDNDVQGKSLYALYEHWSNNPFSYSIFFKKLKLIIGHPFKTNVTADDLVTSITPKKYKKKQPIENINLKRHILKFLKVYSIVEGDCWISSDYILHLYDKWIYNTKNKKPLRPTTVLEVARGLIKNKKTKEGIFFAVDPTIKQHFSEGFENEEKEEYKKI